MLHKEYAKFHTPLPIGLNKNEVENNIKDSINTYIKEKENISALMVFVYRETDIEKSTYTVAMSIFAPEADWAKASDFISYEKNSLVINYNDEEYFNKKINKIQIRLVKYATFEIIENIYQNIKKLEYSIRLDKGEDFITIVFNYKGFMCTYSFDKEKDNISLNVRHSGTNYGNFIELMNPVEYYNEIELSDYIIKDFKERTGYNMIYSYREILKEDYDYLAVVTDGRNLEINENGVSQTGIWKIDANKSFDKVIVFYRDNNENKIYIGDYSHREKVEDRYNIFFTNTKFVGFSAVNWTTFCERTGSGFSLCYLSL